MSAGVDKASAPNASSKAAARALLGAASDDGAPEKRLGGLVLFAFFGLFLGWAALAPLDAAVVARGVVMVSGYRQSVEHRDGGVVGKLAVKEGDVVKAGDVLIELSAPETAARKEALLSQVVDLQMQRERLTAELVGAKVLPRPRSWATLSAADRPMADEAYRRHELEAKSLAAEGAWSEYEARIIGFRQETAAVERQRRLTEEALRGARTLAHEDYAPRARVRELETRIAELQARAAELRSSVASTRQARSEQIRTIDAKLAELDPQLAAARSAVENTFIRAPTNGAVVGLVVHTEGGVVKPGEKLMDIVPEGRELVVEAQVRPEDADNIEIGQKAEVRITAFRGRNIPILYGKVARVSADRFTDERSGAGYFIAQVKVPAAELDRAARRGGSLLRPGLPAEAIIGARKRTALQYMLEPLNQALWRSFREE